MDKKVLSKLLLVSMSVGTLFTVSPTVSDFVYAEAKSDFKKKLDRKGEYNLGDIYLDEFNKKVPSIDSFFDFVVEKIGGPKIKEIISGFSAVGINGVLHYIGVDGIEYEYGYISNLIPRLPETLEFKKGDLINTKIIKDRLQEYLKVDYLGKNEKTGEFSYLGKFESMDTDFIFEDINIDSNSLTENYEKQLNIKFIKKRSKNNSRAGEIYYSKDYSLKIVVNVKENTSSEKDSISQNNGNKKSWIKESGYWYYKGLNGNFTKNSWEKIDGKWYRFDKDGKMLSNKWFKEDGKWYWLESSGAMSSNKWVFVNGNWFWASSSGRIIEREWIYVNGKWYFAKSGGYIAINTKIKIDGKMYSFDNSGAWIYR